MGRNRMFEAPLDHVPQPPMPSIAARHFAVCPMAWLQAMPWHQQQALGALYAMALAEALAVATPSRVERDLLGFWN